MCTQTVILLFLFASIQCLSSFEQTNLQHGNAKIGEQCEKDYNCIPNAFCRYQLTCLCNQYYSPTLDMSMCIASAGLSCTYDHECSSMTNAECRQGVCACKDPFILDVTNSSNCLARPSKVGDYCQRSDMCQDVLGRALCINERCKCVTSYHFSNETAKCIQTRLLYNSCVNDYECSDEVALECKNGECVPKEEGTSGGVKASFAILQLGVLTTLLLILS